MEIQSKIVNKLSKYQSRRTSDDFQINLVVSGSNKIKVVLHFSFDYLNLRVEREIIEDLLQGFLTDNGWYLVPSYFVTDVKFSNCKHKNITEFITIRKNGE